MEGKHGRCRSSQMTSLLHNGCVQPLISSVVSVAFPTCPVCLCHRDRAMSSPPPFALWETRVRARTHGLYVAEPGFKFTWYLSSYLSYQDPSNYCPKDEYDEVLEIGKWPLELCTGDSILFTAYSSVFYLLHIVLYLAYCHIILQIINCFTKKKSYHKKLENRDKDGHISQRPVTVRRNETWSWWHWSDGSDVRSALLLLQRTQNSSPPDHKFLLLIDHVWGLESISQDRTVLVCVE